jgi:hypothetical protein
MTWDIFIRDFRLFVVFVGFDKESLHADFANLAKVFPGNRIHLVEFLQLFTGKFRAAITEFKAAIMGTFAKKAVIVEAISVGGAAPPAFYGRGLDVFPFNLRDLRSEFVFFRIVSGGCGYKYRTIQTNFTAHPNMRPGHITSLILCVLIILSIVEI